jgi:hypothetical protein
MDERVSGAVAIVRKPAAINVESSKDEKAALATVEDVGLASMRDRYFATAGSRRPGMKKDQHIP